MVVWSPVEGGKTSKHIMERSGRAGEEKNRGAAEEKADQEEVAGVKWEEKQQTCGIFALNKGGE